VHVHVLAPVATEGLTYADREALADRVHTRMTEVLRAEYGIEPHRARVEVPVGAAAATGLTV
jgi:hypothetical protein